MGRRGYGGRPPKQVYQPKAQPAQVPKNPAPQLPAKPLGAAPEAAKPAQPAVVPAPRSFADALKGPAPQKAPEAAPKPAVPEPAKPAPFVRPKEREKLDNIFANLDKGKRSKHKIGSGSTADAVRHELKTGGQVGGKTHSIKAQQSIQGLDNWIKRNPTAPPELIKEATDRRNDLQNALDGK